MGKRKQLVKELEAALEVVLEDYRTECTKRIAAELELSVMAGIANMFHRDVQRLTEERDELRLELAGMTSDAALDAAMADIETLTQANEEADATIGALRDDLADMRERLDAALTEAARMRKEWTGDVTAAREIIERKSNEIVELRRDVAAAQRERDAALGHWQNTESLLQERERELDALQERHAEISDARDDLLESLASANTLIGKLRSLRDRLHERARQWEALCFRLGIAQASHIDTVVQAAQAQAAPAEPVVTPVEVNVEADKVIDELRKSIFALQKVNNSLLANSDEMSSDRPPRGR